MSYKIGWRELIVECGDYEEQMTQQMVITSYYTLEGRSFVANLNIGGLMTLGEQIRAVRGAAMPLWRGIVSGGQQKGGMT